MAPGAKNQTYDPRPVLFFVRGEIGSTFHLFDSQYSNHQAARHGVSRVAAVWIRHVSKRPTASPMRSGRLLPKSVRHDRLKVSLPMGTKSTCPANLLAPHSRCGLALTDSIQARVCGGITREG